MSDTLFEPQEGNQPQSSTPAPDQGQAAPQAQEPNPSQTTPSPTLFADQLAGIKDENGRQKYADVNTALNSIPHAQGHISQLETQVAQLQEELNKRQGMEQVLERIEAGKQTNTEQPSVNSLSEADVMSLVDSTLKQKEAANVAYANEVAVTEALVGKFGSQEKALEQLGRKASELGVNVEFLQSVAQKSPKAVLDYFDTSAPPTSNPIVGGSNTEALYNNAPPSPDALAEARSKLMGQSSPLLSKWRAAAPNSN